MAKSSEELGKSGWLHQLTGVSVAALLGRKTAATTQEPVKNEEPPAKKEELPAKKEPPAKVPVTIQWAAPADMKYAAGGVALGATQLNATASVAEAALAYDPPAGTLLDAGTRTLTARVADAARYDAQPVQVSVTVRPAKAVITWPAPAPVNVVQGGFKPGAAQLNATVVPAEAGVVYSADGSGGLGAGSHRLEAKVKDSTRYEADPVGVDLVVRRLAAQVRWDPPAPQRWTDGGFALGDEQLCAQVVQGPADVAYDPPAGTRLEPGKHPLKVSWGQTDVYEASDTGVDFTVEQVPVVITWATPAPCVFTSGGVALGRAQLNASSDVAKARIVYDPSANTRLMTAGKHPLTAAIADKVHYAAAPVSVEFDVTRATPEIVWEVPDPVDAVDNGFVLGNAQLNATISPGGGALTYTPAAGELLSGIREHELVVTSAESATHVGITGKVKLKLRKARASVAWAAPPPVDVAPGGYLLSATELNATCPTPGVKLRYTPALGTALMPGTQVLKVEADEPDRIELAAVTVPFKVKALKPKITWAFPNAVAATGGPPATFKLTSAQLNAVRVAGDQPLVYTLALDTALEAGTHQLTVAHAKSALYDESSMTVLLTVLKNAQVKTGFDAACGAAGAAFRNPPNATVKNNWDTDVANVKTQAQAIMQYAKDVSGAELVAHMDSLTTDRSNQGGDYPNLMWKLPGGLQIRYKPRGDKFTNPEKKSNAVPMFCIEVLSPACATQFSERQQDIAAKISLSGSLAPKGPGDTRQGNDDYIDGAVAATHLSCRKTNARIVAPVEVEIPAGEPLSAELLGVSLDPGDADIKLNPKAGNKLPTRRDEKVMVDAGETDKFFKAERKTITVHVVKAKPELHWQAPADIAWTAKDGAKLTAQHLNATAVPPHLTARIEYKPKLGTSLPPGEHKLSARLENSSVSDEAVKTVQVFVRKATPAITWNTPRPQRDAGRGFTLDAKVLNAKTDAPGLEMIYTPPAGTVLGAGSHELQACTKPDKNYRQATARVTLTVQPAPPGQAADDADPDDVADPGADEPADGKPGSSEPGAGKRGGDQRGGGKPGSGKSGGGTNKGQRKKS